MPARAFFRALFYLPVVTSWVVVSLLFRYLFITDGGLVNGVLHIHVDWLGQRWTAMLVLSILGIWKGVGWSMVIFLAALQGVPRELNEAAAVDGAKAWAASVPSRCPRSGRDRLRHHPARDRRLQRLHLRLPDHAGGPLHETQVLLTYMYQQAFSFLDFGYGSALAFILTLIVFVLSLVQLRLFRRPSEAA